MLVSLACFLFVKQTTAYEMRISDWSSDVCSSDLSSNQIVPAIIGESEAKLALSAALEDAGILASAIRPPTVPKGTARIRFTLSAAHSDDDVVQMVETVVRLAAR